MRFIFGLVFAILVAAFALLFGSLYRPAIDEDLEAKVNALLDAEGIEGVVVEANHMGLTLSGHVPDVATVERATELADRPWGSYPVHTDELQMVPAASATFVVREQDDHLQLFGILPDEELREALSAAARASSSAATIDNRIEIDSALASPVWAETLPELIAALLPASDMASIAAHGRTLTIVGEVGSPESKEAALAAAKRSGLEIIDRLSLIEWQTPSVRFERRGEQIAISGLFPDELSRQAALSVARDAAAGAQVLNQTLVHRHVRPVWWADHISKFVPAFIRGSHGDATLTYDDEKLVARGTAFSPAAAGKLERMGMATADKYPIEVEVAMQDPPGSYLIAEREGRRIVLTGEVGTLEDSHELTAAIAEVVPKFEVVNRLRVVEPRAPLRRLKKLYPVFPVLFPAVKNASLRAEDDSVVIKGTVPTQMEKQRIGSEVEGDASKVAYVRNQLSVPPPDPTPEPSPKPTPEPAREPIPAPTTLEGKLAALTIEFIHDSAYLSAKNFPKVESAAKLVTAPDTVEKMIVIVGHGDLSGSDASNQQIALERAGEVRKKLIGYGVAAERISLVHLVGSELSGGTPARPKGSRVEITIPSSE